MLRMFLQSVKINDKNVLQSLIRYEITILAAKIWNCKDVGKKSSNLGGYYNATIVGCFITSTSYTYFDTSLNIIVNEAYSSKIKKRKNQIIIICKAVQIRKLNKILLLNFCLAHLLTNGIDFLSHLKQFFQIFVEILKLDEGRNSWWEEDNFNSGFP
jgi:hypothetical protein